MLKRFLMGIVAVVAAGTIAKADFVIDTFTQPTPATFYTVGNLNGSVYSSGAMGIGGGLTRSITVKQVGNVSSAAGGFFGTSTFDGPAFQLNTSNSSSGAATWALLNYSYTAPVNLAVGGSVLKFSFDSLATPTPFTVVVGDGSASSSVTGLVAVSSSSTTFNFALSSFSGVNLNAINSVQIYVNRNTTTNSSSPDTDITIRDIRVAQSDTTPVPAPPVVVLLLAAAPALGLVRFARRKIAA